MSDIKARYVGPQPDGITLTVPVGTEGEFRHVTIPHGGELPGEIDGLPVPASFRDELLKQSDNFTRVQRQTKTTTAAKADEKEE